MSFHPPSVTAIEGTGLRFGVVAARFNEKLVDGLLDRALLTFSAAGVRGRDVQIVRVPGSHEVPWAAQQLAGLGRFDCILALGVLIGGDTNHHEMVGDSVSHALQQIALGTGTPVINGVIVTPTAALARARCLGRIDRGTEFARAALEMAALRRTLRGHKKS